MSTRTSVNPPKRPRRILHQPETPETSENQQITSFFAPSSGVHEASRNRYSSSSLVENVNRPNVASTPIFNSNDVSRTEVFGVVSVNIADTQMLNSDDVETQPSIEPSTDENTSDSNIHNIYKEINKELQQELQRSSALVGEIFDKFKDRLKTENEILNDKNAFIGLVQSIKKECEAIKERQENCEKLLEANGREYDEKIVTLKTDYEQKINRLKNDHEQKINRLKNDHEQKIDRLKNEIAELKSIMNQHFP